MTVRTQAGSETPKATNLPLRAAWLNGIAQTAAAEPNAHPEVTPVRETPLPALPDFARLGAALADDTVTEAPEEEPAPSVGNTAQPRVVYQSTKSGPASGGTSVTILGSYFANVTEVLFGGERAASFKVVSSNRLVAVAPPHKAGVVDVRIATATTVVEAGTFTFLALPVVTQVKPDHAPTRGGTLVVVHGGNFIAGKTLVYFGKRQGRDVKVLSSRLLVVKAPPAEAGSVLLAIATPDGLSEEEPFVYT